MSQDKQPAPSPTAEASVQDVLIFAVASLSETRASHSRNHILRIQHYLKVLAEVLKDHPRFAAALTPQHIAALYQSAPLCDIGPARAARPGLAAPAAERALAGRPGPGP